jgi:hypothetical protein
MRWANVNSSMLCSASLRNTGLKRIGDQVRLLLFATDPDRGCDVGGAVVYKSERIALQVMTSVGAARSVRFVKIGDPGAVLD